jgi:hypothetical protein
MAEVGSVSEPERHVHDAALGLECHIYGHAPVQADGRLAGRPLYFRARWSGWTFTLCTSADIEPAGMIEGDEPGFFRDGELEGFALWGDYGVSTEASYMPYAEAERIIRECAARYLAASGAAEPDTGGASAPAEGDTRSLKRRQ